MKNFNYKKCPTCGHKVCLCNTPLGGNSQILEAVDLMAQSAKELNRAADRIQELENDNSALQNRVKELEGYVKLLEKALDESPADPLATKSYWNAWSGAKDFKATHNL